MTREMLSHLARQSDLAFGNKPVEELVRVGAPNAIDDVVVPVRRDIAGQERLGLLPLKRSVTALNVRA